MEFCKITVSLFDRSLSWQKVSEETEFCNCRSHKTPPTALQIITLHCESCKAHSSLSLSAHDPSLITLDSVTPSGVSGHEDERKIMPLLQ
ncbi:hypothetical protein CEXT_625311 [Caerostris extrusa]|uniref:Uncharacterized protein n=1 Tax=Caerostris extrusa TaxID=172846 RepID=A0AAV4U6R2_CAEEX|nr:hypothetical protein CEXT_625311 [Caerostris extrusa]